MGGAGFVSFDRPCELGATSTIPPVCAPRENETVGLGSRRIAGAGTAEGCGAAEPACGS
jgi:hypothetical protein